MKKSKFLKFVVLEFIQWAALASTVFVAAQKFATLTDYWLVVASSIGYVAVVTLCVWLPTKYALQWKKIWRFFDCQWNSSIALYVVLCSFPCCLLSMIGLSIDSKVDFQSVSTELLIIMLLVVDIAEKIKSYKIRGDDEEEDDEIPGIGNRTALHRSSAAYAIMPSRRSSYSNSRLSTNFCWEDKRLPDLLEKFLAAYDVRLILGMADYDFDPNLIRFGWYFPIYIFGFISMGSFILTSYSKYKSFITVLLLDFPFFFLRLSILCVYGEITNVLFLLKNFVAIVGFAYFWAIRPRIFKNHPNRPVAVSTVEGNLSNGGSRANPNYYNNGNEFEDRSRAGTFDDYRDHPGGELYDYNHDQTEQSEDRSLHHDGTYHHEDEPHHEHEQSSPASHDHYQHLETLDLAQDGDSVHLRNHHSDESDQPEQITDDQQLRDYDTDEPISRYQAIKSSKKAPRKSIIKKDVFAPPDQASDENEIKTNEVIYTKVNKQPSKREARTTSQLTLDSVQKSKPVENFQPSTHLSDEILDYFPPPPPEQAPNHPPVQAPSSSSEKLKSIRSSVRDVKFSPGLASQIAQEAAERNSVRTKSVYNDTSMDVQL